MTNEEKLKLIDSQIDDARLKVSMLLNERNNILIEMFESKSKFKIGVKVKLQGNTGEIVRYKLLYNDVCPVVKFFNKDGSIGKRESTIYSWEKAEIL